MASFRKAKKDLPPEDPSVFPRTMKLCKTTFFGTAMPPPEFQAAVPLLHALPPDALRPLLQQLVALLRGTARDITDEQFLASQRKMLGKLESLELTIPFDGTKYGILFSGLYTLLRVAVRNKTPGDVIRSDLLRMHVPQTTTEDLLRVIKMVRPEIESFAIANRIRCPRLEQLRWRVDVVISSGSLSRVMRPTILMQMMLSTKVIKTFEVSVEQFNQLRFGVAKVLNDMQQLERHPIMRIVNEFEKKDREIRYK